MMKMGEFLTIDELKDLTGYQVRSKQCDHLRKLGIKFLINRFGQPKVSREHVRELCCDGNSSKTNFNQPDINVKGLRQLARNHGS